MSTPGEHLGPAEREPWAKSAAFGLLAELRSLAGQMVDALPARPHPADPQAVTRALGLLGDQVTDLYQHPVSAEAWQERRPRLIRAYERVALELEDFLDAAESGPGPASTEPDEPDQAVAEAERRAEETRSARVARDRALDEARASFSRQTPRAERKLAAARLRDLGCSLDQIGRVFGVTREMIRQDLLPAPGDPDCPDLPAG